MSWVWLGSGSLLAALSLATFAWALLWDRARGRLRCPKCWYAADGLEPGTPCPECGRKSKSPRMLRRTRRRWRWALAAVLLLMTSAVVGVWPQLQDGTWAKHAPTTVLILATPRIEDYSGLLANEIAAAAMSGAAMADTDRFYTLSFTLNQLRRRNQTADEIRDPMWSWQKRLLAGQLAPLLEDSSTGRRGTGPRGYALYSLSLLGPHAAPALPEIVRELEQDPPRSVESLIGIIAGIGPDALSAFPAVLEHVQTSTTQRSYGDYIQVIAVDWFATLGPEARAATPTLIELLDGSTVSFGRRSSLRRSSILALASIGPDANAAIVPLIGLARDSECNDQGEAILALCRIAPLDDRVRPVLIDALLNIEVTCRETAAETIREHPEFIDEAVRYLTLLNSIADPPIRIAVMRGLGALRSDQSSAALVIREGIDDADPTVRLYAVQAAAETGLMDRFRPEIQHMYDAETDELIRVITARLLAAADTEGDDQ